ncbi:ammonium transporter AmtB-like domain-containing protein [Ochromonadaceae sp. CCMP2298]|nr:ammonium transporter AmtB-like domain-containing protein [Ochromonadaceae sp. CCMP2298]
MATQADYEILEAAVTALETAVTDTGITASEASLGIDIAWLLVCATLVFFMQAGFAMLEAGSVRSKNSVNILFKNLIDSAISAAAFWWLGYGFAYGDTRDGFIGASRFGLADSDFDSGDGVLQTQFQGWFFQWAFTATAATIVSGCVAERCKLEGYFLYSAFITVWIYPVIVHWCWGGGWLSPFGGQVDEYIFYGSESNNFIDFAGSGVVHATGGILGFVAATMLGPRKGRFNTDGTVNPIPMHSLTLAVMGTFILWVGWYGFNPGSTLAITGSSGSLAGKVAVTTTISASFACLTSIVYMKAIGMPYDIAVVMNCILAGLVSITAGCAVVELWGAMIIGIVGCFVYLTASKLLLKHQIDDPLDASPIHGACGIWGVIAVGIFGNDDNAAFAGYQASANGHHPFRTGEQLGVQIVGMLCMAGWCLATGYILFFCIDKSVGLRVSEAAEDEGLDSSEHGHDKSAHGLM